MVGPATQNSKEINLSEKKLFLVDNDGVLTTGTLESKVEVIGGYKLFGALRKKGIKFSTLGSASNFSTQEFWSMLRSLGFMLEMDQIWNSPKIAALHLREELGNSKCLVIGEEGLIRELRAYGHRITDDWRSADAVVVGHDRFLSFEKLTRALRALNNKDSYFLAVNKVRWYYIRDEGPELSPGAIVAALEFQSGRKAVVAGKPSIIHFRTVLDHFGVPPQDAVMIGDVVDSDLVPAKSLGIATVLVKSIENWDRGGGGGMDPVDLVVENVDSLVDYL